MTGDDLRSAGVAVRDLFARVPDGAAPVPTLGTDVVGVAAHILAPSRGSARACEG
ncbi:hypothetical protein [Modestobacter roseus]|uniref:Uncharacterized protein n=1 Tax=Modestobacter roseus TaxID=1181884 RepID=A0A562IMA5_9ACTN|nr:hypothetical protein [Modestobacter roseus]TWH72038.1 hypothetical protein JD78_00542 [Modestobacter roseus]